jgi:hypothetical protein
MNVKRFVFFALKVMIAHIVTYFVAGAIAYPLTTQEFYVGANPIFASFMRTQADQALWAPVMTWFVQAELLRGLLIAIVLYPFFDTLVGWAFWKRALAIMGLYVVLGFWAAAVAAPGTIEGMVYLRPEFTSYVHLKVQPEIVGQGIALGLWVAAWMTGRPRG